MKKDVKEKKKYTRPEVKKVKLDIDVLLVPGCKTSTGSAGLGTLYACKSSCTNNAAGS